MTAAYGSSVSFGSRVRSKSIVHNTYTGRRIIFHSKPTPIHEPVHKYDFNCSYSIRHFSRFTQEVSKELIDSLSQKFSYASKKVDLVINGFSPNEVRSHLHICDNSIFNFCIRGLCLGFSITSNVYSLYRFINQLLISS